MSEMHPTIRAAMNADMQGQEVFRKTLEYALEYVSNAPDRNVFPTDEAIAALSTFDEDFPNESSDSSEIVEMLHALGSPASMSQIAGRYFGFVNGSSLPAALAAKTLATYWDQNAALQVMSPIVSKLETVVEKWLVDLLGLPEGTAAGFVSGTSTANFCAIVAARYRLLINKGWNVVEDGLFDAPQIRVVAGGDAHASVLKALSLAGIGKGHIEWVEADDQGRIKWEEIPELDDMTILLLQAGNVNSGAFDNFKAVCARARAQGAWVHVDGAFGLWAGGTGRFRHLTEGYEHAHSWAADAHKTLNTPYDSGVVLCCDRDALVRSLHMTGDYIIEGERDGMFYVPEMSRRARVVELWAALKFLGRSGVEELVSGLHQRAVQFADLLRGINGFEVLNDVVFNQIIVQCSTDELTDQVLSRIQQLRVCWVGGSKWNGRKVIRISVCSWATTSDDIEMSAASFKQALELVGSQ